MSMSAPKVKKHAKFTEREDNKLSDLVEEYGDKDWDFIASKMKGRNKRQCRERWHNYLSPSLNVSPWSPEEDALLIEKHGQCGPKWVRISKFFPNRTDTMIKNRFQMLKRQEQRRQRVDIDIDFEPIFADLGCDMPFDGDFFL